MQAARRLVLTALALACASTLAAAQVVTELAVRHRAGQTFVTWRERATPGLRYRVYRAERILHAPAELEDADLLGEVDDRSSRNQGRSLATGVEHAWVIEDGGPELAANQGLFVHTVAESARNAYYVVTCVLPSGEVRAVVPGDNENRLGIPEHPAPPQPVLQTGGAIDELWAHWVSDRDTPFQPALSLLPSRGYNLLFQRGTAAGPHGLVVRLHAAGQMYSQAWPQRFEIPQDVDSLALSDLVPFTSYTLWFGSQERMPAEPNASTRIWNYTQQRMTWEIDWMARHLGAAHDPERVYVVGGSMGAIGGMYLVGEHPERFAAALLRNGLWDATV